MSKPKRQPDPSHSAKAAETRIDMPHALAAKDAKPPAAGAGVDCVAKAVAAAGEAAAGPSEAAAQQIRTQAAQLAAHLRDRQRELDHREAQLNARIAQFDSSVRSGRLWVQQREEELKERGQSLEEKEQEVKKCLARLAMAEAAAQQAGQQAARRMAEEKALGEFRAERQRAEEALRHEKQQIDARREASLQLVRQMLAGLEKRRVALEARSRDLEDRYGRPSPELLAREEQVQRATQALQTREHALEQSEAALAAMCGETEKLRAGLVEDRQKAADDARAQRQQMAAEHRRALAELAEKRRSLALRSEHVDHCRAALEELRTDLERMHRETLEIRLATEELWVQLSGAAPPARLTRSLSQIRAKLAEQYRLVNDDLTEQRRELEAIRSQLTEQHEKLVRQKDTLRQWAARREEEIEAQAARLVSREQQLDKQEAEMADHLRQWQTERLGYRQEIERLRGGRAEPAPVPR